MEGGGITNPRALVRFRQNFEVSASRVSKLRLMSKLKCSYQLDDRIDAELGQLCWDLLRAIQPYLGDRVDIPLRMRQATTRELLPDPVMVWTLYYASLILGASDGALTLSVHNLGREARILTRQVFEYLFKAQYFAKHPREARRELETEPFRELWLLDDLGYDRRTARYRRLKAECDLVAKKRPRLYEYAKKTRRKEPPTVPESMGRQSRRRRDAYGFHYRLPSRTLHGSVLGIRDTVTAEGVKFDSRDADPHLTLLDLARYLAAFLRILNGVFSLGKGKDIDRFSGRVRQVEDRLLTHLK